MVPNLVVIDGEKVTDWASFHQVFAETFGFPDFYGKNMDAWIDCMTSLSDPEDTMTTINCAKGQVVTLQIDNASIFKSQQPELFKALVEAAAFVNWRLIELGEPAVLALSYDV